MTSSPRIVSPSTDTATELGATRPKIFLVVNGRTPWGDLLGLGLAEDGTSLAGHCSSTIGWAKHDLGIGSNWQHEKYAAHYPNGYELVDLIDLSHKEAAAHPEFAAALKRCNEKDAAAVTQERAS